jgi:hypothetical protein
MNYKEPTPEQCSTHADLGDGWIAIWYPQMGGYVGRAVVKYSYNSCFEAYVWHDGEFPFDGEDIYGDVRLPRHLHHCDPDQFISFGEQVKRLVTKGE